MKKTFVSYKPKISIKYDGTGDLLIFLHGIGGNKENWYSSIEILSKSFNVVALDLLGHGESDDFQGPMNFFDIADDIYKLIST